VKETGMYTTKSQSETLVGGVY